MFGLSVRRTCLWIVILTFVPLVASAADWPQWRGANRDGKATGFTAPQTWPKELTQKWKVPVGTGDATPALVGDRLYVFGRQGGNEVTLCLNAATGKEIWKDEYAAAAISGPDSRVHAGPRSSPAVAGGKVVTLGVNGVVSCLDAVTGKMLWRKDEFPGAFPRFHTSFSPVIVDGMAIAHLGGSGNGTLMAFDLATGNPKWKWAAEGPAYASPVVATLAGIKQIVTVTEKSVAGLALADGKLLWQIPFAAQGMAYNTATPIIEGDTVIYIGQNRGAHAVKIEKQGDAFAAKPVWDNPEAGVQFNTPVLKDGLLFGLSDKQTLFCLDAKTGKTNWIDETKRGSNFGAIVDVGASLMALPNNGQLVVFKPNAKQYEQEAQIKVSETAYAHPVVSGKQIFVKDQDSVILWALE